PQDRMSMIGHRLKRFGRYSHRLVLSYSKVFFKECTARGRQSFVAAIEDRHSAVPGTTSEVNAASTKRGIIDSVLRPLNRPCRVVLELRNDVLRHRRTLASGSNYVESVKGVMDSDGPVVPVVNTRSQIDGEVLRSGEVIDR